MRAANILKEVLAELKAKGKKPEDVVWVGTNESWTTWAEFAKIADGDFAPSLEAFDRVFKEQDHLAPSLKVVGDGWWLERRAPGSEGGFGWEYKELPVKPRQARLLVQGALFGPDYMDWFKRVWL